MQTGKIIQSLSGFYDVLTTDQKIIRTRARGNFRKQKIKPVVGDWVDFEDDYLRKIHPRTNELVRPLIANVDQALVVISSTQPEFSFNLLDRFLVVLEAQKVRPLICVSKTDLLSTTAAENLKIELQDYQKWGYLVFSTSEIRKDHASFQKRLTGRETVLAGQTGAGKSTLLNYLCPELNLETAEISTSLNRGKHTTRKVTLYPYAGGLIADTPGFSSLAWQQVDSVKLPQFFPEFVTYGKDCKYRSCLHLNEPGCAVKEAVAQEQIKARRYQNYCQFQAELKEERPIYQKKSTKRG
ncbi:ribosome small subunit-dependent GTPase A [Lactobacillus sp. DCY120]|uniref:Small ribosomal subunit biogenesis GTPase RsgA n=1 Tax=Bombilactobacillus apium TaxID=2675299 RepID=A0A850R7Z0_9LACO|nr:ribosome small subunit-dependent GTPase A [Bombilactobacillus apium]NVY96967.1 ribosome small subunit-dependent GTPase A [Bombilactobacillus apium]